MRLNDGATARAAAARNGDARNNCYARGAACNTHSIARTMCWRQIQQMRTRVRGTTQCGASAVLPCWRLCSSSCSVSLPCDPCVFCSQAAAARESLFSQGSVFAGVRGKLTTLGTTFPVVGKLMSRINVSKQRDMIVLACVIATCMFFTFIYILYKP